MFKFLNIKTNTLGKSAFILAFLTLSSQILAVVRDKIFSIKFGAGIELDIYYAAFKIPDVVFLLVGTLISAFILIPFFEKIDKDKNESLQDFIDKVFYTFIFFMTIISLIIFIFVPQIAEIFFSGFEGENLQKFIDISRIMLISPMFLGLSRLFIGLNQRNGYFLSSAITGVFYNLSIIFGALFLYPFFGFLGVIIGVIIGAVSYFLVQLPPIFKEGLFPKKIMFFSPKESWDIFKIAAPRSIALVMSDLLLAFLIARSSILADGSVTIIAFALNIFMVPIHLIALSYSSAAFPQMTKYFNEGKIEEFKIFSRKVISRVLFFGFPVLFFFFFYSDIMVGFLLGSGKFGWQEIHTTALIVSIFSLVVVYKSILIMLARIFYAMGRTWFVFWSNLLILFVFLIIYFVLSGDFFVTFLSQSVLDFSFYTEGIGGLLVLAISYTSTLILGAIFSIKFFKKITHEFSLFSGSQWKRKIFIAFISIAISRILHQTFFNNLDNSFLSFFYSLTFAGLSSLILLIIFSEIFGGRDYLEFKKTILNLLKKQFLKKEN